MPRENAQTLRHRVGAQTYKAHKSLPSPSHHVIKTFYFIG
jgi:hypothetical protein